MFEFYQIESWAKPILPNLTQKIMSGLIFLMAGAMLISAYALFFIFNFRSGVESIVNIPSALGSNVLDASLELNTSADDLTCK